MVCSALTVVAAGALLLWQGRVVKLVMHWRRQAGLWLLNTNTRALEDELALLRRALLRAYADKDILNAELSVLHQNSSMQRRRLWRATAHRALLLTRTLSARRTLVDVDTGRTVEEPEWLQAAAAEVLTPPVTPSRKENEQWNHSDAAPLRAVCVTHMGETR